ncbi:MAG: IS4 family transposase [Myxococcota bacterium]
MDVHALAELQRGFNAATDEKVTYKPFRSQLAKPQFPLFAKALFAHLLTHLTTPVLKALPQAVLARFEDIIIQDGSSFGLHHGLKDTFPGRFTTVCTAAVELHVAFSVFLDAPVHVELAPDSQGERDFLPQPSALADKLLLTDRGYQDIDYCCRVAQAGGSFIVHFKTNLNPTILHARFHGSRQRRFENKKLRSVLSAFKGKSVDLLVQWPNRKGKPTLRLVLIWNPAHDQHMHLATNLDRKEAGVLVVMGLYRLRWQIELLFKHWKSWSNVHKFITANEHIAEGLIWFGLCAAFIKRYLAHATESVCEGIEISTMIVAKAARHHLPQLLKALRLGRYVRAAIIKMVDFLAHNAKRTNLKRESRYGRRQAGLQPVWEAAP